MPNYTWTTIEASEDVIAKMKELMYTSEEKAFDFNKLIPMPETLNVTAGSTNDTDIYWYLSERNALSLDQVNENLLSKRLINIFHKNWIKTVKERIEASKETPNYEMGRTLCENYTKYGATNWYDWRNANWGTKWNAFEVEWEETNVTFTTAWAAPEPILSALCKKFPNESISISSEYEEGYIVYYANRNGELVMTSEEDISYYEEWDE